MGRYGSKISTRKLLGMALKAVRGGLLNPPRRIPCGNVREVSQRPLLSLLHRLTGIAGRAHLTGTAPVTPAVLRNRMADHRVISQQPNPLHSILIHIFGNTWINHPHLTHHPHLDYQFQSRNLLRPRVLPVRLPHGRILRLGQNDCQLMLGYRGNKALRRHVRRRLYPSPRLRRQMSLLPAEQQHILRQAPALPDLHRSYPRRQGILLHLEVLDLGSPYLRQVQRLHDYERSVAPSLPKRIP